MIDNPCTSVLTSNDHYIVTAHLDLRGCKVVMYTLDSGRDRSVKPLFHANDPRVPEAYTIDGDYWDADKTFALIELWESNARG